MLHCLGCEAMSAYPHPKKDTPFGVAMAGSRDSEVPKFFLVRTDSEEIQTSSPAILTFTYFVLKDRLWQTSGCWLSAHPIVRQRVREWPSEIGLMCPRYPPTAVSWP